ncbi:MAG: hypothetical protein AMJ65_16650 [Phycisphaerae bacterium SG8_4]|jgi:glycosyltransferase involved in cell wall biosynthesis|nr:MAG: hypothetical protein AMJ65_16650 [Phycisphaerae bacterium SG8_4]
MKKLKCLYLANFDPTVSTTGTTTRGRLFLRKFAESYETEVVHFGDQTQEGRDAELVDSLAAFESIPYSHLAFYLFSPKFFAVANRVLRNGDHDFIFADCEKAGLYAYLLSKKCGLPFIYNSHNVEYQRYISMANTNVLRYVFVPYVYAIERLACSNAALTISISQSDASVLQKWSGPSKIRVLPCAFDEESINPFYDERPAARPVVLMVGNFSYGANRSSAYRVAREIVPAVVHRQPDVNFRFVGGGFPEDIQHANIQAAGFVSDLKSEYEKASVIIAPIEIGGGVKIKVVEALASGKFLVTTEKGMEGIDYAGLRNVVVTPIDTFAEHISQALTRRPSKTEDNWSTISERFGTRKALDKLVDSIDGLLGKH